MTNTFSPSVRLDSIFGDTRDTINTPGKSIRAIKNTIIAFNTIASSSNFTMKEFVTPGAANW